MRQACGCRARVITVAMFQFCWLSSGIQYNSQEQQRILNGQALNNSRVFNASGKMVKSASSNAYVSKVDLCKGIVIKVYLR